MSKIKNFFENLKIDDCNSYHPYLFLVSFILLLSFFRNDIPISTIFYSALIMLGLTFALYGSIALVLKIIIKKNVINKASILTTTILFVVFPLSFLFYSLRNTKINSFVVGSPINLLVISLITLGLVGLFVLLTKKDLIKLNKRLNKISNVVIILSWIIFLIIIITQNIGLADQGIESFEDEIVKFVNDKITYESDDIESKNDNDKKEEGIIIYEDINTELEKLPNIYYILLDGYTSSYNLDQIYNYDNSDFTDYLTDKGFYIAKESNSNYANTYLSVSSSTNMQHVTFLGNILGEEASGRIIPNHMIKNNKVMNFLKTKGYKIYHDVEHGNKNTNADYHGCGAKFDRFKELFEPTMIDIIDNKIGTIRRMRYKCSFNKLKSAHDKEGPIFVFAQIKPPHPVYVFDKDGNAVLANMGTEDYMWKQKDNYIEQLMYVNKVMIKIIDKILAESETPPVIIIQGDHGTGSSFAQIDREDGGGWEYPENKTMLKERMGILNAYYLPELKNVEKSSVNNEILYSSITPVNSFRIVFNQYFDMELELLEDDSFYSSKRTPYRMVDITDKVKIEGEN